MAEIKAFFNTDKMKNKLQQASDILKGIQHSLKYTHLKLILEKIVNEAPDFDQYCQYNIELKGTSFDGQLSNLITNVNQDEAIDILFGTVYQFIVEFELSQPNESDENLLAFLNFGIGTEIETGLSTITLERNKVTARQMPIAILKKLIRSEEIAVLAQGKKKVEDQISTWETKLQAWDKEITDKEKKVDELNKTLDMQRQGLNFVALSKGFINLEKKIEEEKEAVNKFV